MSENMKKRLPLTVTIAAVAATAVLGAGFVSAASANPSAAPAAAAQTSTINGYRNVGYFPQWGVYARDFKLKKLQDSGGASKLTNLNYAFGNINNQSLECFIANKAQGEGPNGSDGAGDAWADFGMGYTAANSVAGVADAWDQKLAGSFNQLKQLKAKNPQLKPMISIGGWTWSKNFSRAAATDASRKKLVSSCVNLYLKGNLPVIDGRGGDGAAAGVFEGIDIDWEWPGSNNGNVGNSVDTVNDKANFKALLKEFRTQMDALGAQTGKRYELSAFTPANPADIASGGWNDPEIFNYLDFGNVQGYDLWGAWAPTMDGHQGNLYDDPQDPRPANQKFSVDKAIKAYTSNGVKPSQLTMGLAMYGRGWQGVTSSTPWGAASSGAPGRFETGINNYDDIKNVGTDYYNAAIGAAWRYDGDKWWSYDNAQTIKQKADYIEANGLGGGMWWDLSGDQSFTLGSALVDKFRAAKPGPVTGGTTPPTTPPTTPTTTPPTTTPPGGACGGLAAWSASAVYTAGNQVSYQGQKWQAKWWTQNEPPKTADGYPWQLLGNC